MADPDVQIREGCDNPDTEIRRGGGVGVGGGGVELGGRRPRNFFPPQFGLYIRGQTPRAPPLDPPLRFKYAGVKHSLDITIFISFQGVLGHRGELYIIPRG